MNQLLSLFIIFLVLIIPKDLFSFPDAECTGASDANPPFSLGFSSDVTGALLTDDETMYVSYGENLKIVNMASYALAATQPPALSVDAGTDGRLMSIAYSSILNRLYASQNDGDLLIFDLNKITTDPTSVTIAEDHELGPVTLDNNGQNVYIADNTNSQVHIVNLSSLSLVNSVTLAISSVTSFVINDAAHVPLTNEQYFATNKGCVFVIEAGGLTATEINVDSTRTANLIALSASSDGSEIFAANETGKTLVKISTSTHAVLSNTDLTPNLSPAGVVATKVSNPSGGTGTALYAYVSGAQAVSVVNTASDFVLDMGSDPAVEHEPIPMASSPKRMFASSQTDGYVYSINSSQHLTVISANPFITVSSLTYGEGASKLTIGGNFTIAFQADEAATCELRVGGGVTANGTQLKDAAGATSWSITDARTDISVAINYDDNASTFQEGDNNLFVFCTDSGANRGRRLTIVSVDTPPPNVTLRSAGFGTSRIYVTFDRLDVSDLSHYNVYVDTDPDAVLTKTEVAVNKSQPASGSTVEAEVGNLTDSTIYYIAVEAVDVGGNVSPSRTNTFADGSTAFAIPQQSAGPVELSGETGNCSLNPFVKFNPVLCLMLILLLLIPSPFQPEADPPLAEWGGLGRGKQIGVEDCVKK